MLRWTAPVLRGDGRPVKSKPVMVVLDTTIHPVPLSANTAFRFAPSVPLMDQKT